MPFGLNPVTGRPGPAPNPARDGDKKQARQRINVEVRTGRRPRPSELPCADCDHLWAEGERRHEYDHHLGYAAEHHRDVEAVCTTCHRQRERARLTHCKHGHEYTENNKMIGKDGHLRCRQCRREYDKRRRRGRNGKKHND